MGGTKSNRPQNPDVPDSKNPDVAHEESDVSVRAIVLFGAGLSVSMALVYLLMYWMFGYFAAREKGLEPPTPPLTRSEAQRLPPEPRLQGAPGHQIHPLQEIREMRVAEEARLNSYGWVDQPAGIVRIPIEQAMKLLVERGLPARSPNEFKGN